MNLPWMASGKLRTKPSLPELDQKFSAATPMLRARHESLAASPCTICSA
jgi:hypothetical protein